jgi:ubiquinone biosynthesis protein COQ9
MIQCQDKGALYPIPLGKALCVHEDDIYEKIPNVIYSRGDGQWEDIAPASAILFPSALILQRFFTIAEIPAIFRIAQEKQLENSYC